MRRVQSLRQLAEYHDWTPESELPDETVYNEFRSAAEEELGSMLPGDDGDPLDHVAARHISIASANEREMEKARAIHTRVEEAVARGEHPELQGMHGRALPRWRDTSQDGVTREYNQSLGDGSGFEAPEARPRASGPGTVRGFKIVKAD